MALSMPTNDPLAVTELVAAAQAVAAAAVQEVFEVQAVYFSVHGGGK
jgi:hypothetical protein